MSSLPEAAALVEIPDGSLPEYGITIVSYLDADGVQKYGFATHGDTTTSAMIGLMQMAGHKLIHDTLDSWDDEEGSN